MRPYTAVQKVESEIQAFADQWHHQVTSSLMMPLIGEGLNFGFCFLNGGLRPHQNNFVTFNYVAEGQHEQIIQRYQ